MCREPRAGFRAAALLLPMIPGLRSRPPSPARICFCMTIHRKLLVGALLAASCIVPVSTASAQRIHVQIGDRPYYNRGPEYWQNDRRYVFVPGHWRNTRNGRTWVRGRYVARERRGPLRRLERRHRIHRSMMFGG